MQNFSLYVDVDALPQYTDLRNYYGINITAALNYAKDDKPSNSDIYEDTNAIMRLWKWEWQEPSFSIYRLAETRDGQGNPTGVKLEPVTDLDLKRMDPFHSTGIRGTELEQAWLDLRFDRYYNRAQSKELGILDDLAWPQDLESLKSLIRACRALNLYDGWGPLLEPLKDLTAKQLEAAAAKEDSALRRALKVVLSELEGIFEKYYPELQKKITGLKKATVKAGFDTARKEAVKSLRDTNRFEEEVKALGEEKPGEITKLISSLRLYPKLVALLAILQAAGQLEAKKAAIEMLTELGGRLKTCVSYQFLKDPNDKTPTPPSLMGFLANLSNLMAPIPQRGQLAHVVHTKNLDSEERLIFVPLAKAVKKSEIGKDEVIWEITEAGVTTAYKEWNKKPVDERKTEYDNFRICLTLSLSPSTDKGNSTATVYCTAIPANAPCVNALHDCLWAKKTTLCVGNEVQRCRETVAAGFDLMEPALRGLDGIAVLPDPSAVFRLFLRLLRDHVLPSAKTVQRISGAMVENQAPIKEAWTTFYSRVSSNGQASAEWEMAVLQASPAIKKAYDAWNQPRQTDVVKAEGGHRTIRLGVKSEPNSPTVQIFIDYKRQDKNPAWTVNNAHLLCATSSDGAAKDLGQNTNGYILQHLGRNNDWLSYNDDEVKRGQNSGQHAVELDICDIVKKGLRSGRHRLVYKQNRSQQEVPFAEFSIATHEEPFAPIRALVSGLGDPQAHTDFIVHLLNIGAKDSTDALALLSRHSAKLREEWIPQHATRAIIRESHLKKKIIRAMCHSQDANAVQCFCHEVMEYWDTFQIGISGLPGIDKSLDGAVYEHAQTYLKRAPDSQLLSQSALPLEIELSSPLEEMKDFDGDAKQGPGANDPLEKLSGAAVMLKRSDDQNWRCLNAGALEDLKDSANKALTGTIALPIAYRDGVATVAVNYNGVPVAIHPPTTNADGYVVTDAASGDLLPEIASYSLITEGMSPQEWQRPPLLAYGKTYQAAGFFIHQCGALPSELANRDAPWLMKAELEKVDVKAAHPSENVTYWRTTPIGPPRLSNAASGQSSQSQKMGDLAMQIPDEIVPLARALPRVGLTLGGPSRQFFRRGLQGTINLAEGPWTLTIEGIEPRGFGNVKATLTIDIKSTSTRNGTDALSGTLRVQQDSSGVWLEVTDNTGSIASGPDRLKGPVSMAFGAVPTTEPSASGLWVTFWDADGQRPVLPGAINIPNSADWPKKLQKKSVFIEVCLDGTGNSSPPSVAFGAPVFETAAGTFNAAEADEAPVVLLGNTDTFTDVVDKLQVFVRPPAVDFEAWDRHKANQQIEVKDSTARERLKTERGEVHAAWRIGLELNEEWRRERKSNEIDISLDDPAVTGFHYELVPLFGPSTANAKAEKIDLGSQALNGERYEQDDIKNTVQNLIKQAQKKTEKDLPLFDSVDKKGQVWELLVRPIVNTDLLAESVKSLLASTGGMSLGPPARVLFEVATAELPQFEHLRSALLPALSGHAIHVSFSPGSVAPDSKNQISDWAWRSHTLAYVHDVHLARQSWRWNGRPLDPYPFPKSGTINDADAKSDDLSKVLHWEVQGFGDRDQEDFLLTNHVVMPFRSTNLRKEDLTGDDRAQHWRFRLEARSRYANIMKDPSKRTVVAPGSCAELNDRWRRAFVPAVVPDVLKPPSIRVVLPLTESTVESTPSGPPPLLVVLDDPWFDIGGLAEQLLANIEAVQDIELGPDVSGTMQKGALQQIGPDPIRTAEGWVWLGIPLQDAEQFDPYPEGSVSPVGPIGYTYDVGASAQRFAHSSFLLSLTSKCRIPDWSFVKLSFRRLLVPEGCQKPDSKISRSKMSYTVSPRGLPGYAEIEATDAQSSRLELRLIFQDEKTKVEPEFIHVEKTFTGLVRITAEQQSTSLQNDHSTVTWLLSILDPVGRVLHKSPVRAGINGTTFPQATKLTIKASSDLTFTKGDALIPYGLSKPTPGMWCQLAADFSLFCDDRNQPVHASELLAKLNNEGRWQFVRKSNYEPVSLKTWGAPEGHSKLKTELWVVATERITDAFRRPAERYLGTATLDGASLMPQDWDGKIDAKRVRFRILEVETRKSGSPPGNKVQVEKNCNIWRDFWSLPGKSNMKEGDPADAHSRIVKISQPIDEITAT